MKRIIERVSILKPPGLPDVVGGVFVCTFGFVGWFACLCLIYTMQKFVLFHKEECRISFLVV